MDKIIKINGIALPAPTKYDVGIQNIVKGGRVTTGEMVFDIIAVKRKIELDLTMLTSDEIKQVLNLVSSAYFEVEYQDPQEGVKIGEFYSGDRKTTGLMYVNGRMEWKGLAFNVIER